MAYRYYVLITSPNRKRRLFRSFFNPTSEDILDAASKFGIHGKYLKSAENNAVIGDMYALRYILDKNQMIIVTDSLDYMETEERISFPISAESTTDEDLVKRLDTLSNTDVQAEVSDKLKELRSQFPYVLGSLTNILQEL